MNSDAGSASSSSAVRLAGPPELTCTCALPSLGGLVAAGLHLQVTLGRPAEQLLEGLAAGAFDIVISTINPPGLAVVATHLFEEEFVLVAAPGSTDGIDLGRLRHDRASPPAVRLIAYAEDLPIVRSYWRAVFGAAPAEKAVAVVPDLRGLLELAAAGGGVTVLPRYLCRNELDSGRLVALFDPSPPPSNSIYLVTGVGVQTDEVRAVSRRLLSAAAGW
jgi:DNA-binding transcriptional LysR family regulator